MPSFIKDLSKIEEIYTLNKGEYVLDKIESKGIIGQPEDEHLNITVNKDGATTKVLNYENYRSHWTKKLLEQELLRNEFGRNYLEHINLVKVPYDEHRIMFSRKETISQPKVRSTYFDALKLDIKVSPRNSQDAESWYLELLKQKISKRVYFLSDTEFQKYANDVAKEFILFEDELMNQYSRRGVLEKFKQEKDFYIRAKLETIDYLNY